MVLRLVATAVLGIARTAAEDGGDVVAVMVLRTDVHEGILHIRHLIAFILFRSVVVEGVVAAEDGIDTTKVVFHIGRGLQDTGVTASRGAMQRFLIRGVPQAFHEVVAVLVVAEDGAAEVVAAIDNILNPREAVLERAVGIALTTDIHLGMAQDIGFARAGEGIVDAAFAQIYIGVTADITLLAGTVDILGLGHTVDTGFIVRGGQRTIQVHDGAIAGIVAIEFAIGRV